MTPDYFLSECGPSWIPSDHIRIAQIKNSLWWEGEFYGAKADDDTAML